MTVLKSCVLVLLFFGIVYCLRVVPERAKVVFVDHDYLDDMKFFVKRYGRKSGYYLNLEGHVLKTFTNNVTIHLIFYEYLHNEYRRTFVEMHFKLCDFLNELYVGAMFKNVGLSCPVLGQYHLMNMTVPTENFPYVMPFEKFRVDCFINITATNAMVFLGQAHAHLTRK